MSKASRETQALNFIKDRESLIQKNLQGHIGEALYTFSELGLFKDSIDNVSVEQAVQVWALVESVRQKGNFPLICGCDW